MSDVPDDHKEEDEFSGVFDNAPTTPSEPYGQKSSDDHGGCCPGCRMTPPPPNPYGKNQSNEPA